MKFKYWKITFCIFITTAFLCFSNLGLSQSVFSHVYNYNFRNGLNIGVIRMAIDKQGNLWFKDHNTLGRYNGNSFNYYIHDEDLKNSCPKFLSDLTTDKNGVLWMSAGDGLYKYSTQKGFERHRILDEGKREVDKFVTISSNSKNQLWCGNGKGAIYLYDATLKKTIKQYFTSENNTIRKIYESENGKLWVVADDGFYVINAIGGPKKLMAFDIKTTYPDENLFKICESLDLQILVNFRSKIYLFDSHSTSLINEYDLNESNKNFLINDFLIESKNQLTIATTIGLLHFNTEKRSYETYNKYDLPKEFNIESEFVNSLIKTENNILFVGTSKGISKIQNKTELFTNFDLGKELNSIILLAKSLKQWNGDWIVVTASDGIFRFNPVSKSLSKISGFEHLSINSAYITKDQNIIYWLENNKLYSGEIENTTIKSINVITTLSIDNGKKLKIDHDDIFWFIDKNKLYKYNPQFKIIDSYNVPLPEIIDFNVDKNDQILLVGDGLIIMNQTGKFEKINIKTTELFHNVEWGQEDEIYVGAYSGLLVYNKKSKTTSKLSIKNGLLRDFTGNLIKEGNYMWITYLEGLQKINLTSRHIETYNYEDGLADNYSLVTIGLVEPNIFYLGKYGYLTYENNKNNLNLNKTNFSVDQILLDSSVIENPDLSGSTITIPSDIRQIMINFNFPSFLEKSQYNLLYRLQSDADSTWKQLNPDLTLEFTDLTPNNYRLEVRAFEKGQEKYYKNYILNLVVEAPFYKTVWFQLMMFILSSLIVASVFYLIYRNKLRQMKKLENLRISISRDLHDEMGSSISSIKLLSEFEVIRNKDQVNTSYHKIAARSSEIMEEMSDIVWSINPSNDNMARIIEKIQSYTLEIFEPKGIEVIFKFEKNMEHLTLNLDKRRNLYLIIKESVNNIAKYASAQNVIIELKEHRNKITTSIKDDGIGYDEAKIKHGNGIINIKKRAQLLNGTLNIKTGTGLGTEIILEFPV